MPVQGVIARDVRPRCHRYHIVLEGAVHGVGLLPFVSRLASSLALAGHVETSTDGLVIEVEGGSDRIQRFIDRLVDERPATSLLTRWRVDAMAPTGVAGFVTSRQTAGQT